LSDYGHIISKIDSGDFTDEYYDGFLEKCGYDSMSLEIMRNKNVREQKGSSDIFLLRD